MSYVAKINIDAGHGSNTSGKRTVPFTKDVDIDGDGVIDVKKSEQYREHYANVMIAAYLDKELVRCGFEVFKTGWDDEDASNDSDTSLSNRQAAIKAAKCDGSVSIHFNATGDGVTWMTAAGCSTHIHATSSNRGDSVKIATVIQKELLTGTTQNDRGIVYQSLAMCNCTSMNTKWAVLIENAFMTNEREAMELMANASYCKEQAQDIARGVCAYYNTAYIEETTATITDENRYIQVMVDSLNVYERMSTTSTVVTVIEDKGIYTCDRWVVATSGNVWARISTGWIRLSTPSKESAIFVTRYKVIVDSLNVRKGPGTSYEVIATVAKGSTVTVVEENDKNTWGRRSKDNGWISLGSAYVEKR